LIRKRHTQLLNRNYSIFRSKLKLEALEKVICELLQRKTLMTSIRCAVKLQNAAVIFIKNKWGSLKWHSKILSHRTI